MSSASLKFDYLTCASLEIRSKSSKCNQLYWPRWLNWMRIRLVIRRLRVRPLPGLQHSFMEIDHEIFSMVILSLLLIQVGQLSVSGKGMCTILFNHLED